MKSSFRHIKLPFPFKDSVLAAGAELKTSFAILNGKDLFVSRVFDDLRAPEIFEEYKRAISNKKRELRFEPKIIACDLHPEYISTKYAKEIFKKIAFGNNLNAQFSQWYTLYTFLYREKSKRRKKTRSVRNIYQKRDRRRRRLIFNGVRLSEIQHHHAHIAGCMAENGLRGRVIGVAFDGTGYGSDGNIWGGEFLLTDYRRFERAAHLAYVPMPGGDKAVIEPARMAFSYLYAAYKKDIAGLEADVLSRIGKTKSSFFAEMIKEKFNSPLTSSAGGLFDAVSSLAGVRDCITYEGEAAIELERIAAADCSGIYEFKIKKAGEELMVEFWPMIKAIVSDLKERRPSTAISRKFHNTLAEAIKEVSSGLRKRTKINDVALSGGVFQNRVLLHETKIRLEKAKFSVYTHSKTSCADRSLSLGQAVVAVHKA